MQFSLVAIAALATGAAATTYSNSTVSYTTEVHTAFTTVCPSATELTYNGQTYTATTSTTLTITNCPCTVVKPVTTASSVICSTCAVPTKPIYANTTVPVVPTQAVGTTSKMSTATATPSAISASGASQALTISGFSLAGLFAAAAYLL